ncbi:MAG: hypothetical protein HYR97_08235, partial [Candidatus Melainabacteria bacterium]|nr:hypothetical protein [Candidatus Melainabacteria bacterium]
MNTIRTNNILVSNPTSNKPTNSTSGNTFTLNYSPSENKVIITLNSTRALEDKKFLYAVTKELSLNRTVLVNCGEFISQDFLELITLRNGMWSPKEYKSIQSRDIAISLLPDGESPKERTNSKFAASVWNASKGERGGEVDFTSKINILQVRVSDGTLQPHLFIIMQRINEEAESPAEAFQDDNCGGLAELENAVPLFNPKTDNDDSPQVTLTIQNSAELTEDYFLDQLLRYTHEGFEVTLGQEINSPNALKIIEGSDETNEGLNANEVQITYSILEDTMQDVFANLVNEFINRGKSIYIVREDPFFQTQEIDYIIVEKCKAQNKAKITLSDFDDCDYNNLFLSILQKLLEDRKIVTLHLHNGQLDPANKWKISSLLDTLSDEGINVELITGV